MSPDPISPIAPARVRALVLPVGLITKSKFRSFVSRLQKDSIIRLGDISPDVRPDRTTFSPMAFPNGIMLYNFTTDAIPDNHLDFWPFETFRHPLVIVGVLDGKNLATESTDLKEALDQATATLETAFSGSAQALLSQLVIFDYVKGSSSSLVPARILSVPPTDQSRTTAMKTVVCDISAKFLAELASYSKTVSMLESVSTPREQQINAGGAILKSTKRKEKSGSITQRPDSAKRHVTTPVPEFDEQPASTKSLVLGSSLNLPNLQPPSRPVSPANGRLTPTEMMEENMSTGRGSEDDLGPFKAQPKDVKRDIMRDTRPAQPASQVSDAERERNKLKSRQGLILASLYLHAGRWSDALRELVDHTTRAKVFNDHYWHAKGLENILVTMLLLSWARIEFTVPSICYSSSNRFSIRKTTPSGGLVRTSGSLESSQEGPSRALSNLSSLIPDLVRLIFDVYSRSESSHGEKIPQVVLSQAFTRLTFLVAMLNHAGGHLDVESLSFMTYGSPLKHTTKATQLSITTAMSSSELSTLLLRALPEQSTLPTLSLLDNVNIYSGVASIFSFAQLHRKRAMVIRDLLSILIPGLIQARKVGAAEAGIHPAASLAAMHGLSFGTSSGALSIGNGDLERGFHNLLVSLCKTYGIDVEDNSYRKAEKLHGSSNDHAINRLSFGGFGLKTDILRLCANVSEALPNFKDVIEFTALLLRSAGPNDISGMRNRTSSIALPRDEQIWLATKINRTLAVFRSADAAQLESDYWDSSMIRSIDINDASQAGQLLIQPKSTFSAVLKQTAASNSINGPFIHNPFRQTRTVPVIEKVLIAEESSEFVIILQNLYEFDVVVESMKLITEGVEFIGNPLSFVLGPARTQTVILSGLSSHVGHIKVTGCIVKIQGCQERMFSIFESVNHDPEESKISTLGLSGLSLRPSSSSASREDLEQDTNSTTAVPRAERPIFRVIPAQPVLSIVSTSLSQTTLTLLEGEIQTFDFSVCNTSSTTAVNFIYVWFSDSKKPDAVLESTCFRWIRDQSGDEMIIKPGESRSFTIEVFGRYNLPQSTVLLDYANLEGLNDDSESHIYTRRLSVPILVAVRPSVQVRSLTLLQHVRSPVDGHAESTPTSLSALLDMYNAFSQSLRIEMQIVPSFESTDFSKRQGPTADFTIEAGQTVRKHVCLPPMKLANVSSREELTQQPSKPILEDNLLVQKHLAKNLQGRWLDREGRKSGVLDLSRVQITSAVSQRTLGDCVSIQSTLYDLNGSESANFKPGEFFHLKANLTNETDKDIRAFIEIQPKLANHDIRMFDLSKTFVWTGLLRRDLPVISPGQSTEVSLGMSANFPGVYDILVSTRFARIGTSTGDSEEGMELLKNPLSKHDQFVNSTMLLSAIDRKNSSILGRCTCMLIIAND